LPKVGPATEEIASQAIIVTTAIQSGLRPITELFDLTLEAMGNLAFLELGLWGEIYQ
jgi:hypothetical protein